MTKDDKSKALKKLEAASVDIWLREPGDAEKAYLTRLLVQCTLPHSKPKTDVWVRRDGHDSLIVRGGLDRNGEALGVPYGTVPRLLLFWLCGEVKAEAWRAKREGRAASRRIELGGSMSEFMHMIGLDPSHGGSKGDARRLHEQAERLFNATFSFHKSTEHDTATARSSYLVSEKDFLFWDRSEPDQRLLFGSWVELSEGFYNSLLESPVPLDYRALKALKRSPLALDLYAFATFESYRARKTGKPRFTTWHQLLMQLGASYSPDNIENFRAAIKAALAKIKKVYPGLELGKRTGGLELLPGSKTAVQPKPPQIDVTGGE